MNILEQSRLIVAERLIATQNRQLESLRIQTDIAKQRSAITGLLRDPIGQTSVMLGAYLVICAIMEYVNSKRKHHRA